MSTLDISSASFMILPQNGMMDRSISGILTQNKSTLMSYQDYQNSVDRITMRLHSIAQKASNSVSLKCNNFWGLTKNSIQNSIVFDI